MNLLPKLNGQYVTDGTQSYLLRTKSGYLSDVTLKSKKYLLLTTNSYTAVYLSWVFIFLSTVVNTDNFSQFLFNNLKYRAVLH